ncbi:MAG: hypothetical protein LBQ24_01945 [Candidatus Peribacteria bacterium]|jgi:hypothetical protein|nr:hypothetical protein [Candidatus Peribacteria bacterium]
MAKPQIHAQAINAFTLYHKLLNMVIRPKTHIPTIATFSKNGSSVLASCSSFNLGFFKTLYLKTFVIIVVIETKNMIIIPIEYTFFKISER